MIHCYDEWSQIKEIIVGDCWNCSNTLDNTFKLFYWYNLSNKLSFNENNIKIKEQYIKERSEDLDNLANILKSLNIIVYRPDSLKKINRIQTPEWVSFDHPCDNPRDQFLILGDTIIETSPFIRTRYFENQLLYNVLWEQYNNGGKWIMMPRSRLIDENNNEIRFDGAQCMKFGRDILVNVRSEYHKRGFEWLKRHFSEYKWHSINLCEDHLDGKMIPICPGKILLNSSVYNKRHLFPSIFKNWEFLLHEDLDQTQENIDEIYLASKEINVNILMINENLAVVRESNYDTIKILEKAKIDIIPIIFRHSRLFGGGIHCATLDLNREGNMENYF